MRKLKPYEIDFDRAMAKLAVKVRFKKPENLDSRYYTDLVHTVFDAIHAYSEYINIRDTREHKSDDVSEFIITIRKKEN